MTFEEREKEIFFESIIEQFKKQNVKRLSKNDIIKYVSANITRERTLKLFEEFDKIDVKYIHEDDSGLYEISDAGKMYFKFLARESEKLRTEKRSIKFSKISTIVSTCIAILALIISSYSAYRNIKRDNEKIENDKKQVLKESESSESILRLNEELHQITIYLKDTAKVKLEK